MSFNNISDVKAKMFICYMLDEGLHQYLVHPLTPALSAAIIDLRDLYSDLIFERKITKVRRNKIRAICGKNSRRHDWDADLNELWHVLWYVSSYGIVTNGRDIASFQRIAEHICICISCSYAMNTWFGKSCMTMVSEEAWEKSGEIFQITRDWKRAKLVYDEFMDEYSGNARKQFKILEADTMAELIAELDKTSDKVPL